MTRQENMGVGMHLPRVTRSAPAAFCLLGAVPIALAGCGSDEVEGQQSCDPGERFNPVSGRCVEDVRGGGGEDVGDASDTGNVPDAGEDPDSGDAPDAGSDTDAGNDPDSGEDPDIGDGDDYCAFDMDLSSSAVCEFYAHSPSTLYLIDPFRLTLEEVRSVPEGLFDIDTHPDGRLFGISPAGLYRFVESTETWDLLEPLSGLDTPNGLCIDNFGQGYITSANELYTVDLDGGVVDLISTMSGTLRSSGDCVVDKGNALLMSSSNQFFIDDSLMQLDGYSGQGSLRGRTG